MVNYNLHTLYMTHIESTKRSFVDRLIINDRTIYEVRNWVRKSYILNKILFEIIRNLIDYIFS